MVPCGDPVDRQDEDLLTIVPEKRTRPYNMHKLVEMVVDAGSIFEIQPTYGKTVITCLARLNGYPVTPSILPAGLFSTRRRTYR